jgi:hypothetical protein
MGRYAAGAAVLHTLASADTVPLDGSDDPLRLVLRTCAEACERFDEVEQEHSRMRERIVGLEDLLSRVADALEAAPLPIDGGSWAVFRLAREIRESLGQTAQD